MGEIEEKIIPIFKGAVMNALGAEELFIEAAKDLVKDEIKRLKNTIVEITQENVELKKKNLR